ncbi:MAG: epoxyqueuosine reductase QueH [Campylobacterota bacterium]
MLVHICCSVDSHFFLKKIQELYPKKKIVGYFYNPNIHPYSEYKLRLMDVTRSCDMLHIPLIVGEYDYENWYKQTKCYANEPEKGRRCDLCFEERFEATAKKAKELGIDTFTSTLLASPKKSLQQLEKSGDFIASGHGVKFFSIDLQKNGGGVEQNILAKKDKLYRQNYCGCFYALQDQREDKNKPAHELHSSIQTSNEPNSLECKLNLYEKRLQFETKEIGYELVKNKILNYRLYFASMRDSKGMIPSFVLPYSVLERKSAKGRVEKILANVAYFNKDEVKICDISYFNTVAGTSFYSVTQLMRARLKHSLLMKVRRHIVGDYDFSPIIITNTIPPQKLFIDIDAECFFDSVEELKPHANC